MDGELKCSLCSRSFPRSELRYNPVGGGFRHQASDYLCQPCWQVLCGQPWPTEQQGGAAQTSQPLGRAGSGLPPVSRAQRPQQQQQQHAQQQQNYGGGPAMGQHEAAAAAHTAMGRRCHSFADIQRAAPDASQPRLTGGGAGGWQPTSLPDVPAMLGSADADPRWGVLAAAASAPYPTTLGRSQAQHAQQRLGMGLPSSAPTFTPFELKNMMDEASLEIFESQSHLLDPETRLQLQKQRQYLEWQQNSMEESGPMRASLERTDSAGSGSGAPDLAGMKHELRVLRAEKEATSQRVNELCQQLQEKKRQLYAAIQKREQLKEQLRSAEGRLKDYQEVVHCRLCLTAVRNCVVLPCLHFLYCDNCFKKHCSASPTCPACSTPVTGFQTLIMMR